MVGIKTGIQNRNHHAAAVIAAAGAVENTGAENVDFVLNQLSLALLVDLADNDSLTVSQRFTGSIEIPSLNGNLKTAEQRVIAVAGLISDLLLIQKRKDLCLLISDLLIDLSSLIAVKGIILEAHGLIAGFICIHKVGNVNGNDHRNLIIILNIARKLEHNRTIQIVLKIQLRCIIHQLHKGRIVTGHLTIGNSKDAKYDGGHEHTDTGHPN